jgi:hypothetical protein
MAKTRIKRLRGMTAEQMAEATKEYDTPGFVPAPIAVHPKVSAAERRVRGAFRRRARPKG